MRGIDRLELLRGEEKHYTFSDRGGILEHPPFEHPAQVPVTLERNWRQSFRLPMCAEPGDRDLKLLIQVVVKKTDPIAALPVAVNGGWPRLEKTSSDRFLFPCGPLSHHTPDHTAFDFEFPIALIQDGWNEIIVENGGMEPITVVGIEIAVMKAATLAARIHA